MIISKYEKLERKKTFYVYGSFFMLSGLIALYVLFIIDIFNIKFGYNVIGIAISGFLIAPTLINTNLIVKVVNQEYARLDLHYATRIFSLIGFNWFLYRVWILNNRFIKSQSGNEYYLIANSKKDLDNKIQHLAFKDSKKEKRGA